MCHVKREKEMKASKKHSPVHLSAPKDLLSHFVPLLSFLSPPLLLLLGKTLASLKAKTLSNSCQIPTEVSTSEGCLDTT